MIALMYDGLELGKFVDEDGKKVLKLNNNINKSWLPYLFELAYDSNFDMEKVFRGWLNERIFPKNRFGSKKMLKELGLKKYDMVKIAEITRCSLLTDPYWIVYDENDTYTKHSIRGQIGVENYPYNSLEISNEEDYIWRI